MNLHRVEPNGYCGNSTDEYGNTQNNFFSNAIYYIVEHVEALSKS